jgi:hypothetical protein
MDKVTAALIEALKQALREPGEQRLFRSGKLSGVFAGRTTVTAEAAARALREGLLEAVRTEIKGKTAVEWVRVTPAGVGFLHEHESPLHALQELRNELRLTQEGLPAWLAEMRKSLEILGARLTEEAQAIAHRLEALSQRVNEVLERAVTPQVSEEAARVVPWVGEALGYLDRRRGGGVTAPCPLSELFLAIQGAKGELTLADFHTGLRRLSDRGVLRLLPHDDPSGLPEPEYALLDGAVTYCYVMASGPWPVAAPANGRP